ncbi:MAG: hypothetical protein ACI80V_001652 [Rhodothermales bacterium]|jgi:hypothetical protein
MNKLIYTCLLAAFLLIGCDSAGSSEAEQQLVVEAFLFTGEPVNNVRVTEAIPLSSLVEGDSLEIPVNDATMRLRRGAEVFQLVSSDGDGNYHYPDGDLVVGVGETFVLEVERGGESITAQTTVPAFPEDVGLSRSTLEVAVFQPGGGRPGGPPGGPGQVQDAATTVNWENPNGDLFFVIVESQLTGDPEYILPDFIRDRFAGFRQVNEPTNLNVHDVNARQLEVFGDHRVVVYRINKEYADLYENREQDSRDLNEPATNIQGGLGVFSAFAGTSVSFTVVPAS